ncbi:MAG: VCBS repeat-containing protein [Bdellovibrionales bacterium]|nr:VCBS repeat-containing protein [Bdellovibrionales bacterium]
MRWTITTFFFLVFFALTLPAQSFFPEHEPAFELLAAKTEGKIKQIVTAQLDAQEGQELIVLERRGKYPAWTGALSVWTLQSGRLRKLGDMTLPEDLVYFSFFQSESKSSRHQGLSALLRTKDQIRLGQWTGKSWTFDGVYTHKLSELPNLRDASYARYYPLPVIEEKEGLVFFLPSATGMDVVSLSQSKVKILHSIPELLRTYSHSPLGVLAFEPQFVFRFSQWFPTLSVMQGKQGWQVFSTWMDEITHISFSKDLQSYTTKTHLLNILSEDQRNSGESFVNVNAVDLDGDGDMDFVSNRFTGSGTSFSAQTKLFFQEGEKKLKEKDISLRKDATSGAVVHDVEGDGDQDLIFASSQFSFAAIVRAITKKQIQIEFDFFRFDQKKGKYSFSSTDLSKKIDFSFSLKKFFVDGILPTLDGDFNGDGYMDVMYARTDKELSFLIQQPDQSEFFRSQPTEVYQVSLPGSYLLGDLNGDQKDEVILYGTSSKNNQEFSVLENKGSWK